MSRRSTGEDVATAPDAAGEDGKASFNEASAPSPPKASGGKAAVVNVTDTSPRSSSSLSELNEGVLKETFSAKLRRQPTEEGVSPSRIQPASPDDQSSDPLAPTSLEASSSPPAVQPSRSTQKRTRASTSMGDNVGPSPKRRRGPPRKAAPKDTISAGDVGDVFEDELALEYPKEKVRTMPKKGLLLGHDSARRGRPAARNREEPPWNWELEEAGPAPSRLRGKASAVLADKDKYEPLRLYENSNWVLFDPVKEFPESLPDPPEFLKRFTHYNPGDNRILEYNLVSECIRLKWTPKVLEGKSVRYGQHGPRLD